MKTALRTFLLALICSGLALPQMAQAELSASALLLGTEQGIQPIAIYSHASKRFSSLPKSITGKNALIQHFFKANQELPFYQFGEVKNLFQIQNLVPQKTQCSDFGILKGKYATPPSSQAYLGFTGQFPGVKEYIGTYPTFAFHAKAKKIALSHYRSSGVTASTLQQVHWDKITPFTLKNGSQILILVESHIPSNPKSNCAKHSQISLIEKVGRGYRTRFKRVTKGCHRYSMVSSFSTHKNVDKLLFQHDTHQQRFYEIYQSNHQGQLLEIFKSQAQICKH